MVLFPIIAIPDYELLVEIYQLIEEGNNTTDRLVQKSSADRRLIYGAVSILSFLGLIEKKRVGRRNIYRTLVEGGDLRKYVLDNDFCRSILKFVFNGTYSRSQIARYFTNNPSRKLLNFISSMASFLRKIGFLDQRFARRYRLTEEGELRVFR